MDFKGDTGVSRQDGPGLASSDLVLLAKSDVRARVAEFRREGIGRVGLVPTMGSLHDGHMSLVEAALSECGLVVASVFVNPRQFGPAEDFEAYPRELEADLEKLRSAGVDAVFMPSASEMYPEGSETSIETGSVAEGLCGQSRPGHFQGVATVVAKLFNISCPDLAYFGQKDAQQVAVIRRMAADLDFPVKIRVCPTVRDSTGLALSSRNSYLTDEEREQASVLYRALELAAAKLAAGETSASKLRRLVRKTIASNYLVELEYVKAVDPQTMQPVDEIEGETLLAVAAQVGRARLIDNILLNPAGSEE